MPATDPASTDSLLAVLDARRSNACVGPWGSVPSCPSHLEAL